MLTLIQRFRGSRSVAEQQQLKWVALGLCVGVGLILTARAGAALTGHGLPLGHGAILLEGLFQLGIVIIALGFLCRCCVTACTMPRRRSAGRPLMPA